YHGDGLFINHNGARMQTCHSAQAQHESEHRPKQISAGIFEGVVLRPVTPNLAALAFNDESHAIAVEKAEMIPTSEQTHAQIRFARQSILRAAIKKIDGSRKCYWKRSPILQPYPYVI